MGFGKMDTRGRNVRIPFIIVHPGSGGPREWRTPEMADPGSRGLEPLQLAIVNGTCSQKKNVG